MLRNASLDYARLVAAFGIVFFHSHAPGANLAYAALPFFMMLLIVLAARSARQMDLFFFAKLRAARLLEPWLLWSSVFAGLKLLEVMVTGKSISSEFAPYMLLTGPALHLWFLPFAFFASLVAWFVVRYCFNDDWAPFGFILISLLFVKLEQSFDWEVPLAQWMHILPSIFVGLALLLVLDNSSYRLKKGLGLVAAFALSSWLFGWAEHTYQTVLAAMALLACFAIRAPKTSLSTLAAKTSLSIYLCHPLVASILDRSGLVSSKTVSFALLTCAGAFLVAIMLNKVSLSKVRIKPLEA